LTGRYLPVPDDENTPEKALEALRGAVEAATSTSVEAEASTELAVREDAAATKKRLAGAHANVSRAYSTALEASKEARAVIEAKRRELDAMERALRDQLAPLEKQMKRLQDGIAAVNLYLGTD